MSSRLGPASAGKRSRSTWAISSASSTARVVCMAYMTRAGSRGAAADFGVHLGDQRAGRVYDVEVPVVSRGPDRGRDPVRGEDHGRTPRHLVHFGDEDRAAVREPAHHVRVVHDLPAYV